MWRLAYNQNAALLKDSNGEYWYISFDGELFGCYNSQSEEYNATDALQAFETQFGAATFKRKDLARK
jgi:hypothetical protein